MHTPYFRFVAKWYDFWVGVYWAKETRTLYVLPVPCLGLSWTFGVGATATRMADVTASLKKQVDKHALLDPEEVRQELMDMAASHGFILASADVKQSLADTFLVKATLSGHGSVCDMEVEIPITHRYE